MRILSETKTEHTQKAYWTQLVNLGLVKTGAQLSDSDWEAEVLRLNYTRESGS
jgi:hypothetical protein